MGWKYIKVRRDKKDKDIFQKGRIKLHANLIQQNYIITENDILITQGKFITVEDLKSVMNKHQIK